MLLGEVRRSVSSDKKSRTPAREPKPLISIVIPTYNLENYLPECLESITRQAFRDIEIIAVDGGSTDTSRQVLYEMGEKEPRLSVVPMDRVGPGRARNEGVRRARGEYIWFVDGDDLIPDDCLASVANHIGTARPDVLLIDYEALGLNGRSRPGYGHDLMARKVPECFTLAEQPWVINFPMASWNKIIRREYYLSTSATFWSDWPHEDVEVSYLLLMEAGRLSILNRVCYKYRECRPGSAMENRSSKNHFKIFNPYEALLDRVEKLAAEGDRTITAEIRQALFQRAIWHYTTIFDAGNFSIDREARRFVARDDRSEFFAMMHQDYVRYLPPGYHRPSGFRGVKFLLIEKGAYRTYSALDPLNKLRVGAGSAARVMRHPLGRLWRYVALPRKRWAVAGLDSPASLTRHPSGPAGNGQLLRGPRQYLSKVGPAGTAIYRVSGESAARSFSWTPAAVVAGP
jgi:CDP-glycerol glycerophosphotransferase